MAKWTNVELWEDPTELRNSSNTYYYRKAIITWSDPVVWDPSEDKPHVPDNWNGHAGIYAILRDHKNQTERNRISYIGKAENFSTRPTKNHHMYPTLVQQRGDTSVSFGRIRFERVRSHVRYFEEIEQIVAWSVWGYLWNYRGLETLPGFRGENGRPFKPWIIENCGYPFAGAMPKLIAYPSISIAKRK